MHFQFIQNHCKLCVGHLKSGHYRPINVNKCSLSHSLHMLKGQPSEQCADGHHGIKSRLTSAGFDVTETMVQVSSQDVLTPRPVGPRAEEGANPLLLTHSAGPRAGPPGPPLCPRAVPRGAVCPHTHLVSIWECVPQETRVGYPCKVI